MNKYKFATIAPVVALALAIFIESSQSKIPFLDASIVGMDKVLHFLAFFMFGVFLQLAIYGNMKGRRLALLVILLGAVFGLSDEFHQSFVPGRDADIFDLIADIAGVISSLFLLKFVRKLLVILQSKFVNNR